MIGVETLLLMMIMIFRGRSVLLVEETECSVKTSDLSQEMYKCYHIASSRLKAGKVEMKLTALITDFNHDCLHCSYHDPTVHTL